MVRTWKLLWAVGALVSVGALAAACGSSGGATAGGCVPNAQVSCACLGGTMGIQVCGADGKSYGTCQCGSTTTGGTGGATTTTNLTGSGGSACQCVNPGGELYCGAAACGMGTGGSTTTTTNTCASHVTFAGKATVQFGSKWVDPANGTIIGLQAGNNVCTAMGADHVCDYDDLVLAASKSELSSLATTDTAWLERTGSVTVAAGGPDIQVLGKTPATGTVLQVSKASRCDDWTYATDHLNDGEYVSFENGVNKPTFHLDDDPTAIQTMGPSGATKYIPCGHNNMPRSVLCCYPKCM